MSKASNARNNDDHLAMNVCDCYKDAKAGTIATSSKLFKDSIKSLFPKFENLKDNKGKNISANMKTLHDLEDIYLPLSDSQWNASSLTQSLGPRPILINLIKKKNIIKPANDGSSDNKLPDTYKYAFHDSGFSPREIQPTITDVITAASFIDPARREVNNAIIQDNDEEIDLSPYGFEKTKFKAKIDTTNKDSCSVLITHDDSTLSCNIDTMGNYINGSEAKITYGGNNSKINLNTRKVDIFAGNNVKNQWLNSNDKTNNVVVDQMIAKFFVLCKELGDTMQAILLEKILDTKGKFKDSKFDNTNSCGFTGDRVLGARFRMLGVPFCLQNVINENSPFRSCSFFQPHLDKKKALNANNICLIDKCLKNNGAVLFSLQSFLIETNFNIASTEYTKISSNTNSNTPINEYVRSIFDYLINVNNYLIELKNSIDRGDERQQDDIEYITGMCKAHTLIVRKPGNNMKLISGINSLFPKDFYKQSIGSLNANEEPIYDVKSRYRKSFSEIIQMYVINEEHARGGRSEKIMHGGGGSTTRKKSTKRKGFFNVSNKRNIKRIPKIKMYWSERVDSVFFILYNYFDYVGDVNVDINFLTPIVTQIMEQLVDENKTIDHLPTLKEFKNEYYNWKSNWMKNNGFENSPDYYPTKNPEKYPFQDIEDKDKSVPDKSVTDELLDAIRNITKSILKRIQSQLSVKIASFPRHTQKILKNITKRMSITNPAKNKSQKQIRLIDNMRKSRLRSINDKRYNNPIEMEIDST